MKIDRLPAPTVQALSAWLRQNDVHILHFIGHGDYDDRIQDGVVYFQDRYGRSTKVSPTVLGPYLRDHDPLRLVLLNACQSARVDTTDPFSGMAQGLVQQDCTAVVAMQFPISDGAATTFTGEFYGALADGFPVDQAATSARKALIAEYAAEWATPVLFLRSPDGRVFDHIVAQPTLTAVPTPPPAVEQVDEERAQQALAADAATTQTKRKTADEQPAAAPSESDPMRGLAAAAGGVAAGAGIPTPSTPPVAEASAPAASARQRRKRAASAPPAAGPAYPPPTQPVAVQPTQVVPQQPAAQQPTAQRRPAAPHHSRPNRSRRNRSSRRTSRPTSRRRPTRPGLRRSRPNHRRVGRRRGTRAGGPGRSRGGA